MKSFMRHLDCIFISYDEPNADENFAHLHSIYPRAQRVHGVKGFDAAHKAAANLSNTEYFITVDGDTVIDPIFFNQQIDLGSAEQHVFAVRNDVTGLSSGNGSIKIWSKEAMLSKNTHESTTDETLGHKLDFWQVFNSDYYLDKNYGTTYPNQSRFSAFRAAFREGIKGTLTYLNKDGSNPSDFIKQLCKNKLEVLCTVGLDSRHGIYSILATRIGINFALNPPEWFDYSYISDYAYLNTLCESFLRSLFDYHSIVDEIMKDKYRDDATQLGINSDILSLNESLWFKSMRTMDVTGINKLLNDYLKPEEIQSFTTDVFYTAVILLSPHDSSKIFNLINKG